MSPKMRAPPTQVSTQAGSSPASTRWLQKVHLSGLSGVVVDEAGIVGAGLDAVGAADAALAIDQYHAVQALEGGTDWTDRDAGRLLAVVAQPGQHRQAGVAGLRR